MRSKYMLNIKKNKKAINNDKIKKYLFFRVLSLTNLTLERIK